MGREHDVVCVWRQVKAAPSLSINTTFIFCYYFIQHNTLLVYIRAVRIYTAYRSSVPPIWHTAHNYVANDMWCIQKKITSRRGKIPLLAGNFFGNFFFIIILQVLCRCFGQYVV